MLTIYTVCAVAGSVILAAQFLLMFWGIGDHFHSFDSPGHVHDSTWFFGVVSLKSLIAALAFFGLTGRVIEAAGFSAPVTFLAALTGAAVAMVAVGWLMKLMVSLRHDGTVHIEAAVGLPARVYLTVPANRSGAGKITMNLQDRSVEWQAITEDNSIPTGASVVVVGVVDDGTVEVKADA